MKRILLYVLVICTGTMLNAQNFSLVKEINTTATSSGISVVGLAATGNTVFYVATDGVNGYELWKSDGTNAGTSMVKDINPGAGNGITQSSVFISSNSFITGNGILYFVANDGSAGNELWRSDGTNAGTYMVKDIYPGSTSSGPLRFIFHNGLLFFGANDGASGFELWKSDGTGAGTVLVKDITPGGGSGLTASSNPYFFTALGSDVYFPANNGASGVEIWKTDGTAAGTVMVKDINPGATGSITSQKAAVFNNKIYFSATNGAAVNGTELWVSDGTEAGTIMVKDIVSGTGNSFPNNLIEFNGALFFSASSANNTNPDIWKTDGTDAGTVLVKNLVADGVAITIGNSVAINEFTVAGSKLFFKVNSSPSGAELYATDGTAAGSGIVSDLYPGVNGINPSGLINYNNSLYFFGTDLVSPSKTGALYKSNGTAAGTMPVLTGLTGDVFALSSNYYVIANGRMYFFGTTVDEGVELWSTDGSSAGTNLAKDANTQKTGTPNSAGNLLGSAAMGGNYYFAATDNENGMELWKSDGTTGGTVLVKDIWPGKGSSNPSIFTTHNGTVYFTASDGVNGNELWKTDGTAAGTVMIADIAPGAISCNINRINVTNNKLLFSAYHPSFGQEFWISDGTSAGTSLLIDLVPGTASGVGGTNDAVSIGTDIYLVANIANGNVLGIPQSNRLFKFDAVTQTLTDFAPTIAAAQDITSIGNTLYITGRNSSGNTILWKSVNGGSVTQVKMLSTSALNAYSLTDCNGKLYFNGSSGTAAGGEPWISDGTDAGTFMLKDINPGTNTSSPHQFVYSSGKVYFTASSIGNLNGEYELWATDGTTAGTYLVKDIQPGSTGSRPNGTIAIPGNKVLFAANDGVNGFELWQSNGTTAGTTQFPEINSNGDGAIPYNSIFINFPTDYIYTKLNNSLIFFARSADKGIQLYSGSIAGNYRYVNDNSTTGDIFTATIGNNTNNGSQAAPFATLTYALSQASEGDTIYVDAGTYTEQVTINKGITIIGAGQSLTTVTNNPAVALLPASGSFPELGLIQTGQNIGDVHISNMTVTPAAGSTPYLPHAVMIQSGGSVKGCTIINGTVFFRIQNAIKTALVENNTITTEYIGVNFEGSGLTSSLLNNTITVTNPYFSVGAFVGADGDGFSPVPQFTAIGNFLNNYITSGFQVNSSNANITQNSFGSTGLAIQQQNSSNLLNATCNWYGTTNSATIASKMSGNITFNPWLTSGTDNNAAPGFQPANGTCSGRTNYYVNDNSQSADVFTTAVGNNANNGSQAAPFATLSYAITQAAADDYIYVEAGGYAEQVIINKGITIIGAGKNLTSFTPPATALVPAPGPFAEIGLFETTQNIGDVYINHLSINSNDASQNIIIQSGGAVRNCKLLNGGQGVFFRVDPATNPTAKTAVVEFNQIEPGFIGINCQGTNLTTFITGNTITKASPYYAGIFAGLDFGPVPQLFISNNILNNYNGVGIQGNSNTGFYNNNSFTGTNGTIAISRGAGNTPNASCNWYGSANQNSVIAQIQGAVSYSPWLTNGTDNSSAIGFQPVPGVCTGRQNKYYVNDNSLTGDVFTTAIGNDNTGGIPSAPLATISVALARAQTGDTIFVDAGIYVAVDVTISKSVTILGTNYLNIPNSADDPLLINSTRNAEANIMNSTWTIGANEISMQGLTFNPTNKTAIFLNNTNFSNIHLLRNRFIINNSNTVINLNGIGTINTLPSGIVNTGLDIAENRFEKYDPNTGVTFNIARFKNIGIVSNTFVNPGPTVRVQTVLSLGNNGAPDGIYFANNNIDNYSTAVTGNRYGSLIMNENKIHNTTNALSSTSIITESSSVLFINNLLDGSAGVLPFINYNRQGGSAAGSSSSFTAENNTFNATAVPGTTTLLGSMNVIFYNTVLNPSVVIRGNIMNYGGNLSTVEGQYIRPIMLRGNLPNVIVEKNEITLNGTNLQPRNSLIDLPVCPAITLYTDNGSAASELVSGSVINILNNKIHGFKHSFAAYDPGVGSTPYVGFGNLANGVTLNINNNSFTGDSISINNGEVGQSVNATCNWYGSGEANIVIPKISKNVINNSWLTDGTDIDIATGFQPAAGACNGTQNKFYVNDNNLSGDVFTSAVGNDNNSGVSSAPLLTLSVAYTKAQSGDTIFVDAGTYLTPNLTIGKSVTILGTNYTTSPNKPADRLVLNTVRNADALITGSTFTIASNDVRLEGLAFDPGAKQQVFTGNSGVNNFTFKRNYSKITTGGAFLNLSGPSSTPSGQPSDFGNHLIEDNRFESFSSAICYAVGLGALNDVTVNNNAFISLQSATPKFLINTYPGFSGLTVNFAYTNNIAFASRADLFTSGPVGSARIENNISLQGQRAFVIQPSNVVNYDMQVKNNYIETDIAELSPVHFNASGNISTTTLTNILIENNTIIQNPMGRSSVPAGISAYTSFGTGTSSTIRRNKISFNGDFSSFTSSNVHGINYGGYWHSISFNENEIAFNGINLTNTIPVSGPISSGIYITPDNGESAYLPSTAVINITGNKISGFRNSIAVFDQTNRPGNTFVGYGNLPAGVALNINNNSLTGDVMSINNGTASQQAQASCNWYGSASLQNIMNKVTVQTVAYAPYLTNGTDNDPVTTGFQPVPGSCNNYSINVVVVSYTNVTCHGANNGTINITVSGGAAPYTFAWSKDGEPSFTSTVEDPTNFGPGTYHLSVTDALGTNLIMDQNGNVITIDVTITEPALLTAAGSGTNVSCFAGNNGTAAVLATGGTAPYSYLWSNGAATSSINGLIQGNYTVTITDAKGCTATSNYNVTQPAILTAAGSGTNVSCFAGNNGTATVNVTGGTTPYSYLWSNGATTSSINNLMQGNYTVTVTDANGCVANANYSVTQPPVLNVTVTGTSATCNGSATANPTGGTSPYTYLWNNGATTKTTSNVPPGTYSVVVTDAKGCTRSGTITINGNSTINPVTTLVNVSCFGGNNGSITITGTNTGTAPFTYNLNGSSFQVSNVFSNLTAGVYIVGVKDANGCSDFVNRTISQPTASVTVALDSTKRPCYGINSGKIYITATGPGAKTYSWTGPNGYTSTTQDPINLAAGQYNLTVTNNNGCTASLNVTLATWPPVNTSGVVTDIKCTNSLTGAINVTVSGGTGSGFTFSWNGPGTPEPPAIEDITGVKAGTYYLTVTDAGSGCTVKDTFIIDQPDTALNVTAVRTNIMGCNTPGTVTATGIGGIAPYEYSLDGGAYQTSKVFNVSVSGVHTVTVRDANGCTKTITTQNITDAGGDEYESVLNSPNSNNNAKARSATINIGAAILARIATTGDAADWFKFTTTTAGAYTISLTHPSATFAFNVYSIVNNSPALVPVSTTATTKQYNLNAATTYHIQVTGGLSYSCYSLLVSLGAPPVMNRAAPTETVENPAPVITVKTIEAKLYPNPHQGVFNLQISSPENVKATIQIITVDGKIILTREVRLQKGNGNIEGFSGLYQSVLFYRIIVNDKTLSGKIIGPN